MTPDPDQQMLKRFLDHALPLLFYVRDAENRPIRCFVVSTFVMEVSNNWFLITAGHCINEIEEVKKQGGEIVKCELIDYLGSATIDRNPIILPYSQLGAISLLNYDSNLSDKSLDYGIIPLRPLYVEALKKNGIRPLTELFWRDLP